MAQPTGFTRQFNFNDFQTTSPSTPLPGVQLDNELNATKTNLDGLNANIAKIQRDDGLLANQSVHKNSFDVDALALIGLSGYTVSGNWAASNSYAAGTLVNFNDATYLATVAHTSVSAFATDKAAGKWILLANAAISTTGASVDKFEGNGTQTAFTMSLSYSSNTDMLVFVNGALRNPGDDYNVSGTTLTFSTAPSTPSVSGNENVIIWGANVATQAALSAANTASSNASGFATAASSSATAAASSASSASTSATTSTTQANTSTTQAGNSATSAAAALSSQNAAAASQSAASTSETNAAASAATATTQVGLATTQAGNASTSATASATSASTASTQASNAATSASTASTQATNAANSATDSASSATAASNAQAAAEAALDTFDDRFLGAKSSDPSVDNDGNALIDGALYFNTTNDLMLVYDLTNTQWRQLTLTSANQAFVNTVAGQISPTNNIATVATGINSGAFSGATSFAERYRVSASAPTTSLDSGDLWFDSQNSIMKVYGASGFVNAGSSVNGTANRFAWTVGTSSGSYDGSLTVFPATYDAGFVDVFLNGVKLLVGTDVTATNGSSVTLATAAVAADIVEIVSYGTFTAATELSLADNKKISLGTGQDLELTWDGTDGHISVAGTLNIDGSGETLAKFIDDGAVELYHNNAKKIETTATGVDVTGTVQGDALLIDGNATIDQGANSGNTLSLDRTGAEGTLGLFYNGTQTGLISAVSGGGIKAYVGSTPSLAMAIDSSGVDVTGALTTTAGATIAGGDLVLDEGSPEIIFQTGASHFNWMIAAQENVSNALEISSGSQDGDYSNDTWTPRFVITSAGKVCMNRTSGGGTANIKSQTNNFAIEFYHHSNNASVGYIGTTTTSTSYNTSSDYRLKENVTDITDATTRLKQLNPVRFNFIADADTTVDGFLAHEVSHDSDGNPLVPEAIVGEKDAMRDEEYEVSAATGDIYTPATDDADEVIHSANVENPDTLEKGQQWRETTAAVMSTRSVPDYQGIDQSKLTPLLTKALIEAVEKIEALEARITALEAE